MMILAIIKLIFITKLNDFTKKKKKTINIKFIFFSCKYLFKLIPPYKRGFNYYYKIFIQYKGIQLDIPLKENQCANLLHKFNFLNII